MNAWVVARDINPWKADPFSRRPRDYKTAHRLRWEAAQNRLTFFKKKLFSLKYNYFCHTTWSLSCSKTRGLEEKKQYLEGFQKKKKLKKQHYLVGNPLRILEVFSLGKYIDGALWVRAGRGEEPRWLLLGSKSAHLILNPSRTNKCSNRFKFDIFWFGLIDLILLYILY